MKITFDMEWEQVDAIVISEMKNVYRGAVQDNDDALARAATLILRQFMIRDEFYEWLSKEGA
jgi:hypothetical protein